MPGDANLWIGPAFLWHVRHCCSGQDAMATITYGTSQPIRVLIPVETAYCVRSVLSSLELLSEEYPAPVCDKCRLPMWTRRRVLIATHDHEDVRCCFECRHCGATLAIPPDKNVIQHQRSSVLPFAR